MSRRWVDTFVVMGMLLILLSAVAVYGRSAEGTTVAAPEPVPPGGSSEGQAQMRLILSRLQEFKELERPPVLFDHQRHTETLKEDGCQVCHVPDAKGNITYEYVVLERGLEKRDLTDIYHEKCMKCHDGDAKGSEKARALTCGECHVEKVEYRAVKRFPAVFDHFPHIEAMERGCDTCHHLYSEEQGKLIYEKGKEEACGNCHKEKDQDNNPSMRKAGHTQCIKCHEGQYLEAKIKFDPYACGECHEPEEAPLESAVELFAMRPFEKRPLDLLISYPRAILPPVPFNHGKHDPEKKCSKTCHQFHVRTLASIDVHFLRTGDACRQCHTVAEVKTGADVLSAAKVYHDAESPKSCIGCHTKENTELAAKKNAAPGTEEATKRPVTCRECHKKEEAPVQPTEMEVTVPPVVVSPEDKGPESYVISVLSKKRLPVTFAHSRHVTMIEKCAICHHRGPENERPRCSTCHGISSTLGKKSRLTLISSYHRMCIGCHRETALGPISCNKCHEEREKAPAPLHLPNVPMVTNELEQPEPALNL